MIAAFDHPFLSGLLGDEEMAALLGVEAELAAMLRFEAALAQTQCECSLIPADAAGDIVAAISGFQPEIAELKAGTARDGVVVPALVRQIRQCMGEPHAPYVHFGATSQDVVDTALTLRVGTCLDLLQRRLESLVASLAELSRHFGRQQLMGRTRMQAAISMTVSDRIESWHAPIARHIERLPIVRDNVQVLQLGGAVGTLEKFGDQGEAVRAALATRLGLANTPQWHSQRDRIADLANWLSLVTGSAGKMGQDMALSAQAGDIAFSVGGSSSAMPHKHNPVDAEALVALARFNATQLSGMHHALVHEQERSGAAWTLEWLILPQMVMATGASTLIANRLLRHIASFGTDNH